MNDQQVERFIQMSERRDEQFQKFIEVFQATLKDHDLLVRLDEKFNLFSSSQMEHRERMAREMGVQHASITKAHERIDAHEKDTADKFGQVMKFQYIMTGGLSLIIFLFSAWPHIVKFFKGAM